MSARKIMRSSHSSEDGAIMIILALITMAFIAIVVVATSQMLLNEKRRVKSTAVSAIAYQKAEERIECALWGRQQALIQANTNPLPIPSAPNPASAMFPLSIRNTYCTPPYAADIEKLYHVVGGGGTWEVPSCASPLWVTGILTKGSSSSSGAFTDFSLKIRGVGATVQASDSTVIKPFVACNKLAEAGNTALSVPSRPYNNPATCPLTDTNGDTIPDRNGLEADPGPSGGVNRGWLNFWPECSGTCFADPCAYYDTDVDNTSYPSNNLFASSNLIAGNNQGAHWCWTERLNRIAAGEGTMCECMELHPNELRYWSHPDVAAVNFCSPCYRLSQNIRTTLGINSCDGTTGEMTGNACAAAPAGVNAAVWGLAGLPPLACRGVLTDTNCWACNCPAFRAANSASFCDNPARCNGVYNCVVF